MVAVTERTAAEAAFDSALAEAPGSLPGADVEWVRNLRAAAAQRFGTLGLPTRRSEPFKYTDLRARLRDPFASGSGTPALPEAGAFAGLEGPRLVLAGGKLVPELSDFGSLPDGLAIDPLDAALEAGARPVEALLNQVLEPLGGDIHPLAALNSGLMAGGAVVRADANADIEPVLQIVHLAGNAGEAAQPRVLIDVGAGAKLTIAERFVGEAAGLSNAVAEFRLGEGATLTHLRVFEPGAAQSLVLTGVDQAAGSTYDSFHLIAGGALVRNEVAVRLGGEGAHGGVSGAVLLAGKEHGDTTTVLRHAAPGATCREVFHTVLADEARGVFQGKIIVDQDAQKTDGHQLARALLLSDRAEANVKPELEIYADDVKCSHGATTGALDPDQLFYLRSRGIDEREARAILVHAFLAAAADEIADERLKTVALAVIEDWLAGHGLEELIR